MRTSTPLSSQATAAPHSPGPPPDDLLALVGAHLDAGSPLTAARLLHASGRAADAGLLLAAALGPDLDRLGSLDEDRRQLALSAAACLEMGDEPRLAAGLLRGLGRRSEAESLLARAAVLGQPSEALDVTSCRVGAATFLSRLGRWSQAGRLFELAGRHYDAGTCLEQAGDAPGALRAFARVPLTDEWYRSACIKIASLVSVTGTLDVAFDQVLGPFVSTGPRGADECQAFYQLSVVYESKGLLGPAQDLLERLRAAQPGFAGAAERQARLRLLSRDRRQAAQSILAEEAAFLQRSRKRVPTPSGPPLTIDGTLRHTDSAPPAPPSSMEVGGTVAGRYRLLEQLGRGGMSVVYRAFDVELGEEVALKAFAAAEPESEERFRREVILSRRFAHPNLLRIYDLGIEGRHRYFTMELLRGADLRRRIKQGLSLPAIIDILVQVCSGLEALHAASVVHRDLKPENVFVTEEGVVKLVDFGIAKLLPSPGLTLAFVVCGTPHYMSPEQISDFRAVTPASDLYSLGVVAYELLTGQRPFRHEDLMKLFALHVNQEPVPPRRLRPELPEALEKLILALLAKDPAQRPSDAAATAQALRAVQATLP